MRPLDFILNRGIGSAARLAGPYHPAIAVLIGKIIFSLESPENPHWDYPEGDVWETAGASRSRPPRGQSRRVGRGYGIAH
ncbi:hypothetical protein PBI_RICH_64 [Mycobacterium phage Rich]|uniref:Uncharacterized protein n=1 Tax=Mycobacterium phage Rich TaxID=1927021 RepID=A0A1L6BZ36_9CAUD|nr:hypothetical protein PBI_RICH_64 [Mycobacterium phage Rich]